MNDTQLDYIVDCIRYDNNEDTLPSAEEEQQNESQSAAKNNSTSAFDTSVLTNETGVDLWDTIVKGV